MSLLRLPFLAFAAFTVLGVYGCDSIEPGEPEVHTDPDMEAIRKGEKRKTIFGDGGLSLFGDEEQPDEGGGGTVGVNAFLWRASLDTVSFMPVNSADIFGGIIITDWHATAEAPNERFKLNVYILGRALRADGIRVSVFRQVFTRSGQWVDAAVPVETKTKIEDSILTRARQLRNAALLQQKK